VHIVRNPSYSRLEAPAPPGHLGGDIVIRWCPVGQWGHARCSKATVAFGLASAAIGLGKETPRKASRHCAS